MPVGPVFFLAVLAVQQQASLGLGTGIVRYAGGASFSALTASPAIQWLSPSMFAAASGAVSLLEGGHSAAQGRADVWAAVLGTESGTRLAVNGTLSGTTRSDGVGAGSASAIVEAVRGVSLHGGDGGGAIGVGAVTGVIEGVPGVGSFRLRGRGWWQFPNSPAQVSLTFEGTRFLGAWYTDIVGGVTVDRRRVVGSLWLSGRLSKTYGSTGAASASIQYFLKPALAIDVAGGNYLRDPFQGLPRAGFITAAVRLFHSPRSLGGTSSAGVPARPQLQPLVAEHRGDTLVVRFRMPGARELAIAGNWNAWTPASLRAVGDDVWEAELQLTPGTYYFNLVVDGREWVVPGGVATISDGMGGLIAVLNVL